MNPRTKSRSDAQNAAEAEARQLLAKALGITIAPQNLNLGDGTCVALDGYSKTDRGILAVEVSSQVGKPRPAQQRKLLADLLKLALVKTILEKTGFSVRAILTFIDPVVASWLSSTGWRARALRTFKIEVRTVKIANETLAMVRAAKLDQNFYRPDRQ